MRKKNIILFRGENGLLLRQTLTSWRERFCEKHGEINLLEVFQENMNESIMADCTALGFMGASRMIIFHDLLQEKIKEKNETEETLSVSERKNNQWGAIFEKIPDTNFLIFIDTSKNTGELAKLLESVATLHEFPHQTLSEVIRFVSQELGVEANLAEDICSRLGFYEEFSFGKKYIVGKPDRVYQEIKKLNLFGKKGWTREELDIILPNYREENIFSLLSPLWEKDAHKTLLLWKKIMSTADHELTMATLITIMRKVLISQIFPEYASSLPITPKQREQGRKISGDALKKLYENIIYADIAEKKGELPNKTDAFIMNLINYCYQ